MFFEVWFQNGPVQWVGFASTDTQETSEYIKKSTNPQRMYVRILSDDKQTLLNLVCWGKDEKFDFFSLLQQV